MEIDVTYMVENAADMAMLSGSIAELGKDAGKITWDNSVEYGRKYPLLTSDEARDAAREHFAGYGAWDRETIDGWSDDKLQGMTCQDVAAAIRDMESAESEEEFLEGCKSGRYSGSLWRGDNGHWYFDLD